MLSIKAREGCVGDHKIMKRKRRTQKRAQRGRGLFDRLAKPYKTFEAYKSQPHRLPGIGGYLGAKLALKVLGPKAQKQFAPFMSKFKKVAFI